MFFNIIVISTFLYAITIKSKRFLHMLQQNLYNENNRYLKWVFKNISQFFDIDLFIIAASLVGMLVTFDLENFAFINKIILIGLNIFLGFSWKNRIKNDQNKKPLVITKRVKRLIFTITLLYLIPVIWGLFNYNDTKCIWIVFFLLSIMLYLNPFIVFIANIINYPYERCVYYYYKNKAQNKLKNMPNLKIIGITGSYGKTSSKNILSDILNVRYNALPTPKNLNTYNGLIMTINNNLDKFTDIFIAEMGAYVRGEIKGLCKLVKPKYGILTTIGTAHLETFGSEENIIAGKFELIESLPKDGFAILNGDDPKQVNYKLKNKVKTIWIGIDNKDVDVRACDIKCSSKGTVFDVIFKGNKEKYRFETKLLGKHNVYNILAGIACGVQFDISISELQASVKMVRPVEHRLELKKLGLFYQIDDAYNSNPVGASNACQVLGMMDGVKIVVTPGMIELGEKEAFYNKEFGKQIAQVADYAVLIGEKRTKPIYEGLLSQGFDKDNIVVFNDVREAYSFINSLSDGKREVFALFENDLPDTYNE